ncbi:hypothetical protein [Agrococcus sp. Ld7]|uniref:hypothetical protein n=1 Tax=Agrococcus sp. Ld7 TaxID=649148 RepID=UPI00386B3072
MRSRPAKVTVAAALLSVTALTGCVVEPNPAGAGSTPSARPDDARPAVVVAPAPEREVPPMSPPREQPMPEVPTVRGPYVPTEPTSPPTDAPTSTSSAPVDTSMPTPAPTGTPAPTPTPTSTPMPARLVALLPRASELPTLAWSTTEGMRTAAWSEIAAPAAVPVATALTHVNAARAAGGACASTGQRVDAAVLAAAAVSLAADPAPGAPMDVVLLRYPTAQLAADGLDALRSLGTACGGVETPDGMLGAGADGRVTLTSDDAVLVLEGTARGTLLIAVQHEGAPPEAVTALLAAVR